MTEQNFLNNKSIYAYKTDKNIFEVKDMLLPAEDNIAARRHDEKKSKIHILLTSLNASGKQEHILNHYVNTPNAKVLLQSLINNTFKDIYDSKYGPQYIEYKGTPSSENYGGKPESRVLIIKYQEKMADGQLKRYPYTIVLQRGQGTLADKGAIKPVNLSQPDLKIEVQLSRYDMLNFANSVYDYIRDWEMFNFRKVIEAQKNSVKPNQQQ